MYWHHLRRWIFMQTKLKLKKNVSFRFTTSSLTVRLRQRINELLDAVGAVAKQSYRQNVCSQETLDFALSAI